MAISDGLWASNCSSVPVSCRVCMVHAQVCAAMSSQLWLLLTIIWLGRHSELRKKNVWFSQKSLSFNSPRTLYHLLSRLFLALILASISSKEITSKITLVLVSSYSIPNTQRVPSTITTPITFLMAVLRIWCDTCEGRAEEASSSCSNG